MYIYYNSEIKPKRFIFVLEYFYNWMPSVFASLGNTVAENTQL